MRKVKKCKPDVALCLCVILIVILFSVSACGTKISDAELPEEPTRIDTTSTDPLIPESTEADINTTAVMDGEKAKNAALQQAGVDAADATFIRVKKEKEDGVTVYEITFISNANRYEVKIDASTGAVVKYKMKPVEQLPAQLPNGILTVDEAKAIVLQDTGITDVVFTQIELDRDDGQYRYEIEFVQENKEYEYEIDAKTGTITEKKSKPLTLF